ncbi:PAS domain-containing sensor histidine kinase [Clostridium beijerinckii]|uniref:histidine kinase n=1 Tax=Clostridium beijerinckii TaxID=1520 RepID=A0A1S9N6L4_CLOBE|nr:ATP-binding protein [Clostridium beijerinckii]OOP73209.1 PAS domain-containing sensor histidine kinase [Clostridium beijerinckii]
MNLNVDSDNCEISRELLIKVDTKGVIKFISKNCYRILGFMEREILNTNIDKFLGYRFDALLSRESFEALVLKKDGNQLLFEVVSKPVFNDDSKIVGTYLSLIDISKYIHIEERYNQLIKTCEKTKDVFFVFQILPEFKFIYVNSSMQETLGYELEMYYTDPHFVFEIVHPEDTNIMQSRVDKNTDFSKDFCLRFKHKDGHYVWIEDYLIPTYNEKGDLVSVSGFSRDITERKILEKTLEEQNKVLEMDVTAEINANKIMEKTLKSQEELLVNISHELKTPLNVISATSQLLEMYYMDDSIINKKDILIKYFKSIKLNTYRLSKLINNIVDSSKIEAGFFDLNLVNVNIVNVVEEIVMSVTSFVKIKGLNIIFDTDTEEKIIACDPEKIERIMLNLISNATKFSNDNGEIFVNVKDMDEWVEISVEDNGIGIEEKKLDIIFDRFEQADKSLSRNAEGTGIGLSLVKSIVLLHGGSINVESEYGKGSKFTVMLPAGAVAKENMIYDRNIKNKDERIRIEFSDVYF